MRRRRAHIDRSIARLEQQSERMIRAIQVFVSGAFDFYELRFRFLLARGRHCDLLIPILTFLHMLTY